MPRWGVYIDTETGAPQVSAGRAIACSQALSQAQHALLTESGSVEGAPDYGAGLGEIEHVSDSTLRDVERRVDAALTPLVGPVLQSYDRAACWDDDGYPRVELAIRSDRGEESLTFRLGR